MKKKTKKTQQIKLSRALQRKLAMQQGYYDGRFKPRVISDKKKEESRKLSRKKVRTDEE